MDSNSCIERIRWRTDRHPHRADVWNTLALALAAGDLTAEALGAIDTALRINPEYSKAARFRCFLLAESGRVDDGLREFKRLQTRDPDGFDTLFSLGVYCMRAGWCDNGVELLTRAAALSPFAPYVSMHLAAAHRTVGDEDAAAEHVSRARASAEQLPFEGRIDGVQPSMLDALTTWRSPALAEFPIILAGCMAERGDPESGRDELVRANARYPGHGQLMIELGKSFLLLGDPARAAAWMTAVTRVHEAPHEAHLELGFLHAERSASEEAERAFAGAIELRPLYPDYRFHYATLLLELGRSDEAIEELERVLVLNPSYGHATLHLAGAYLEKNRADDAIAALAVGACRDWVEARVLAAECHWRRGDAEKARELLGDILAGDPQNEDARELLAKVTAAV